MNLKNEYVFHSGDPDYAGKSYIINEKGFHWMQRFEKTKMTFREACFDAALRLRERTNKRLVLPVSGGCDSAIIAYVFDKLEIEHIKIHQVYQFRNNILNHFESTNLRECQNFVPEIIQNVNVVEFAKSDYYQNTFIDMFPCPVYATSETALLSHESIDPENDFIVWGTGVPVINRYMENSPIQGFEQGLRRFRSLGCHVIGIENTEFFEDNPIIHASWYDDVLREQLDMWYESDIVNHSWDKIMKNIYFFHHFPELDRWMPRQKSSQEQWKWFDREVLSHDTNHYLNMATGETYFSSPYRTFNSCYMDDIYDIVNNDRSVKTINNLKGQLYSYKDWAIEGDESKWA